MSVKPQFTDEVSMRLDVLLSQYMQTHGNQMHPVLCPPWREPGRRPKEPADAAANPAGPSPDGFSCILGSIHNPQNSLTEGDSYVSN